MHKLSLNPVHAFGPDKLPGGPQSESITSKIMSKATAALGGNKKAKLHMAVRPIEGGKFHVAHSYVGGSEPQESTEHAPSSLEELVAHVKKHYGEETAEAKADKEPEANVDS